MKSGQKLDESGMKSGQNWDEIGTKSVHNRDESGTPIISEFTTVQIVFGYGSGDY